MENTFKKFGLYNVGFDYLKVLHEQDSEVRYSEELNYENKPYVGVMVFFEDYHYFIPLTSAKPKHVKWKNVSKTHYLIYEVTNEEEIEANDIVKRSENSIIKILSALEINKMIPVPVGCFERIDFNKIYDMNYKALLVKEFLFLQNIQNDIFKKAQAVYDKQVKTGKVFECYCNFKLLEKVCDDWTK